MRQEEGCDSWDYDEWCDWWDPYEDFYDPIPHVTLNNQPVHYSEFAEVDNNG
jgi:hypothetical protein